MLLAPPVIFSSVTVSGETGMLNRLAQMLDAIEREQEAPIYALERLRWAVSEDRKVAPREAKRLVDMDNSGEGRAFGSGWMDFLAFAMNSELTPRRH
jgi:hypothetical protein